MASRVLRPRVLAAALAAAGVVCAGCASVPRSGPAHAIDERGGSGAALDRPYVRLLPPKPQPDDGPGDIVDGFRAAMADFTNGHVAARRFLTGTAAQGWNPDARTVIYGAIQLDAARSQISAGSGPQLYSYDVTPVAVIDAQHGYHMSAATQHWSATVTRQPGGRWRISGVQPGSLLSQAEFDRAYRGLDVYFPSVRGHILVPDQVFLPASPTDLPTAMVQQVVAGPTDWLAPVVRGVAPAGASVRSVSIDSVGVADVSLRGKFAGWSAQRRQELLAALTWTLASQLAEVKAVSLQINGHPVNPAPATEQDMAGYDPDGFPGGSLATFVSGSRVSEVVPPGAEVQAATQQPQLPDVRDPVRPASANGLAAVQHDAASRLDTLMIYAADSWRRGYSASHLTAPTWMSDGSSVWTVAAGTKSTPQQVVAVNLAVTPDGIDVQPQIVPVDLRKSGLKALGRITTLRLSRDGSRVAFITTVGDDQRPYVARVEQRDGQFLVAGVRPVAPECGATLVIERCLSHAADLSWVDSGHVVVLANNAQGDPTARIPYVVSLDGSSIEPVVMPGLPSTAVAITAAPGKLPMIAVVPGAQPGDPAQVYMQEGEAWATVGPGTGPHYPD